MFLVKENELEDESFEPNLHILLEPLCVPSERE